MMKNKSLLRTASCMGCGTGVAVDAGSQYKLWYDKPAAVWTEALPLGNGRLENHGIWHSGCGANSAERGDYLGR